MATEATTKTRKPSRLRAKPAVATGEGSPQLAPPPKLRRRPILAAAAAASISLGALGGFLLWSHSGNATEVVAVRGTIHRGELVDRDRLMTVRVGLDPSLKAVTAAQIGTVIGKRATTDLTGGSLVTPEEVSDNVVPHQGKSVVGVSLTAAGMPAGQLQNGDSVRLVTIPGANSATPGSSAAAATTPEAVTGTIVGIQAPPPGSQASTVNVEVDQSVAAPLASRAASGKVALVLDSRER